MRALLLRRTEVAALLALLLRWCTEVAALLALLLGARLLTLRGTRLRALAAGLTALVVVRRVHRTLLPARSLRTLSFSPRSPLAGLSLAVELAAIGAAIGFAGVPIDQGGGRRVGAGRGIGHPAHDLG